MARAGRRPVRRDWWAAALGATVAAVAMVPFLAHYLPVAREVGRGFNNLQEYSLPSNWSWWNTGVVNCWWGWIDRRWPVQGTPFTKELRLGLGFATTAACGIGLYLGRHNPLGRVALAATLCTVAATTSVPRVEIVYIAAAAVCFALGCLFREPDWTESGGATVVLATAVFLACPPFNDVVQSLIFATIALCMVRIWDRRGRPSEMTAPGAVSAALVLHALPLAAAALIAGFFAAIGALAAYFVRGRRIDVAIATLGLWLATTALLSVESRPWILWQAALGAVFGWAASADRRFRPGSRGVLTIVAVALPIVILLFGKNSLWLALSPYIPGSAAIRTPSRVILVLLVPVVPRSGLAGGAARPPPVGSGGLVRSLGVPDGADGDERDLRPRHQPSPHRRSRPAGRPTRRFVLLPTCGRRRSLLLPPGRDVGGDGDGRPDD